MSNQTDILNKLLCPSGVDSNNPVKFLNASRAATTAGSWSLIGKLKMTGAVTTAADVPLTGSAVVTVPVALSNTALAGKTLSGNIQFVDPVNLSVKSGATVVTGTQLLGLSDHNGTSGTVKQKLARRCIVVETLADLKAISVSELNVQSLALIEGYYASGDGGECLFRYEPNTTTQENLPLTVRPNEITSNAAAGRWRPVFDELVSIVTFGALAGSSGAATSNTTSIQKCINYCALRHLTMYVPKGVFYCNNLYVRYDNTYNTGYPLNGDNRYRADEGRFKIVGDHRISKNDLDDYDTVTCGSTLVFLSTDKHGIDIDYALNPPYNLIDDDLGIKRNFMQELTIENLSLIHANTTTDKSVLYMNWVFKSQFKNLAIRHASSNNDSCAVTARNCDACIFDNISIIGQDASIPNDITTTLGLFLANDNDNNDGIDASVVSLNKVMTNGFGTGIQFGNSFGQGHWQKYYHFSNCITNQCNIGMVIGYQCMNNVFNACQFRGKVSAIKMGAGAENNIFNACGFQTIDYDITASIVSRDGNVLTIRFSDPGNKQTSNYYNNNNYIVTINKSGNDSDTYTSYVYGVSGNVITLTRGGGWGTANNTHKLLFSASVQGPTVHLGYPFTGSVGENDSNCLSNTFSNCSITNVTGGDLVKWETANNAKVQNISFYDCEFDRGDQTGSIVTLPTVPTIQTGLISRPRLSKSIRKIFNQSDTGEIQYIPSSEIVSNGFNHVQNTGTASVQLYKTSVADNRAVLIKATVTCKNGQDYIATEKHFLIRRATGNIDVVDNQQVSYMATEAGHFITVEVGIPEIILKCTGFSGTNDWQCKVEKTFIDV